MSDAWVGLTVLAALPAVVIGASYLHLDVERLRRLAVASAVLMLLAALAAAASPHLRTFSIRVPALSSVAGGDALVRINNLSAVLLPFAAGLWLLTVSVTPRAALDRGGIRRTALATLITLASFLTESAVALLLLSIASVWTFLSALSDPAHRQQRRIVAAYLGLSTLLFGLGVALLIAPGVRNTVIETVGLWLIVIAALLRKGIVPFHAWVPEVFDHGRLGPAILFSAPQVGAYMTVVLIVPRASPEMLRVIAILALGTAVYGAALALVQASARRACGYLFVSQSALVMAGLDCTSATALAGGLLVWLSAGLAFAGLARCVLVLEARRGRLDLTTYHGGFERMPVLAISFLMMGLACTGFPGTLGFVGQELLVEGAVDAFPVMGFGVVIASALTGLAVVRMYFSLFCGRPAVRAHPSLRFGLTPREAWTFVALVVALVGFGVAPRPLVDSRFAASEDILRLRDSLRLRARGNARASAALDFDQPSAPIVEAEDAHRADPVVPVDVERDRRRESRRRLTLRLERPHECLPREGASRLHERALGESRDRQRRPLIDEAVAAELIPARRFPIDVTREDSRRHVGIARRVRQRVAGDGRRNERDAS
ncbi:MAG TPA: proton-conducting transporter membrane subunit [Vicinamibacterales bacterium]|nr:proton-conducting transporter membrane subunit [Vicinamibacterales bacterium]